MNSSTLCIYELGPIQNDEPSDFEFKADENWRLAQGVRLMSYRLTERPQAFSYPLVKAALTEGGTAFPLAVLNDQILCKGRYPQRNEITAALAVSAQAEVTSIYSPAIDELVAIAAAIASHCEPCFKFHYSQASKLGISADDIRRAVETAQKVKDVPRNKLIDLPARFLAAPEVATAEVANMRGCFEK